MILSIQEWTIDLPLRALGWLNDWPGGIKLNTELSRFICSAFGASISLWDQGETDVACVRPNYLILAVSPSLSCSSPRLAVLAYSPCWYRPLRHIRVHDDHLDDLGSVVAFDDPPLPQLPCRRRLFPLLKAHARHALQRLSRSALTMSDSTGTI